MPRLLGSAIVLWLAALMVSLPAYVFIRYLIATESAEMLPGLAVTTLAPAIGFPIPLGIMLAVAAWKDVVLTPLKGALFGFGSVIAYDFLIPAYIVFFLGRPHMVQPNYLAYSLYRIPFSLPSAIAAAIVTALSAWIVARASSTWRSTESGSD